MEEQVLPVPAPPGFPSGVMVAGLVLPPPIRWVPRRGGMVSPLGVAVEGLVLPLPRLRGSMRGPPGLVVAELVLPRPARESDSKIMGLRVAELVLPPWPPGPCRAQRVPSR